MRALRYALTEAAASLWRGRRSSGLAILTIAATLFVLGFFLIVNANLQRLVNRWSEAAELSVYLKDDATPEQTTAIGQMVDGSGLAASREMVSKTDAAARFRRDFPDLAQTADQLDRNPFPASIDVRLTAAARNQGSAVDQLAATLAAAPGVADIRYDRRLLERLDAAIRIVRGVGILIVGMLAVAAALTVANVVRLAAYARRQEIEIMQLVGAPLVYVRGPFVAEGVLQGGGGAVIALIGLVAIYLAGRSRLGSMTAELSGGGRLAFIPLGTCLLLVLGGMILGCIGGYIVARRVR